MLLNLGAQMTLSPNTRSSLTEALQPPSGYQLDAAVATTYSLDLVALLLTELSFARVDTMDESVINQVNPIRRLEALRRYGERTTVFAQAGAIHVPRNFYSPFAFIEDGIIQVAPPKGSRLFHPKVWALRFAPDQDGDQTGQGYLHKVIVLSRNLAMDNSWDTILVLDQDDEGTIEAAPAAGFLRSLPDLALQDMPPSHRDRVLDVARTLGEVRLKAPPGYTRGYLKAIGLDGKKFWPFDRPLARVFAMSPFLTKPAARKLQQSRMGNHNNALILVSRSESFDALGPEGFGGFWPKVLIDRPPEGDLASPEQEALGEAAELALVQHSGLHAKTYVVDLKTRGHSPKTSLTVTGSANLTSAPWGNSVEFVAVLEGPTSVTGTQALYMGARERVDGRLQPKDGAQGLERLLIDYWPAERIPLPASVRVSEAIEKYHRDLAQCLPTLDLSFQDPGGGEPQGDRRVAVRWSFQKQLPQEPEGSRSQMWLASADASTRVQGIRETGAWNVSRDSVTPFIGIETSVEVGKGQERQTVTRRCLVKAELLGDTSWRQKEQTLEVLKDREGVLRYLMFLLGEPAAELAEVAGSGERGPGAEGGATTGFSPIVFERLVRATGRDSEALGRVAQLLSELADHPDRDDIDLDDLLALWDSVWTVHQEVVGK